MPPNVDDQSSARTASRPAAGDVLLDALNTPGCRTIPGGAAEC